MPQFLADLLAVVGAYCGGAREVECVGDAYGECFAHSVCDFIAGEPGDLVTFGGGVWCSAGDAAAEDEGDDALGHVFVDAGEGFGLDVQASLFVDFAAEAVDGALTEFEDAAWGFPVFVVSALDGHDRSVVGDDGCGDADRVAWACGHGLVLRPAGRLMSGLVDECRRTFHGAGDRPDERPAGLSADC
jgi:hypothetical protein